MRWNRKTIIDEIRELHRAGEELNYSSAEANHLNLVRAAAWHYGTWKQAVELAGLDYEAVSKYRRWTRERVIQTIRDHHQAGRDLSWRSVSLVLDPSLAAAALRSNVGFETWREAVEAAGIKHDEVARYKHWTSERVIAEIAEIARKGGPLSSRSVQISNQSLYCAAKRRFKDWDLALSAAGVDPDTVRLRRAPHSSRPVRKRPTQKQLALALEPQIAPDEAVAEKTFLVTTPILPEEIGKKKKQKKSELKTPKSGKEKEKKTKKRKEK